MYVCEGVGTGDGSDPVLGLILSPGAPERSNCVLREKLRERGLLLGAQGELTEEPGL